MFEPAYLGLFRDGSLALRARQLGARMSSCDLCPRGCHVDRQRQRGACGVGALARLSSALRHNGEEPAISGTRGSGTIFFAGCNLHCLYCQNHQISQAPAEWESVSSEALAATMLRLQALGVHNLNFVSPTHVSAAILEALVLAAGEGLRLPLVWNTNGYESLDVLRVLDGVVDIYLPDLKYAAASVGHRLSGVPDYPETARAALREMHRQVGILQLDEEGVATRGLIVRHLVLPRNAAGTPVSLRFLAEELGRGVALSLMSQYAPVHRAREDAAIGRLLLPEEYERAVLLADSLGLREGWIQDPVESPAHYRPDFREDSPFEPGERDVHKGQKGHC